MNSTSRTIAKNASILMATQVITWGMSFLLTVILPRRLGAAAMGQFQIADSLWAVVMIFAGFGMDTYLMKEVSREPGKIKELFSTILSLRLVLLLVGGLGVIGYVQLLHYSLETSLIVYLYGVSNILIMASVTCEVCLKGLQRMEYSSLGNITAFTVTTVLRIAFVLLGKSPLVVAAVGLPGTVINLLIQYLSLRKLYPPVLFINWKMIRAILVGSSPYLFVYLGIVLYHQVDTLVISWFLKEREVGWYGVSDQLFGTMLFIPNVFIAAVFPALSNNYAHAPDSFHKLARKSLDIMMLASVPIGLGIFVIANQAVVLLFGPDFAKSGPILAVRGIVLIMTYLNMLFGFLLISMDRQKAWAAIILIAVLATFPLDILLVPWCEKVFANGALGGGLSFLLTELFMAISGYLMLPRGTFNKANAWFAARTLFAGLVMAGVIFFVRDDFIAIPIALGAIIYIGLAFSLKLVTKEDRGMFTEMRDAFVRKFRGRFAQPVEVES